jgi:NAD(P)-dependent dehydrogenase (short-subunit alcohol dehydrogenase family)
MLLKDKVVIVSGVGPGMGQAMARIAAAEGARVTVSARNKAYITEVSNDIVAKGGQAIAVPCDVANEDECIELAERTAAAFGGRIDGLINSAKSHGPFSVVENSDLADFTKDFDIDCLGALRLTRACVPYLRNGGAVVNVSSMATVRPYGDEHGLEIGYAAAKGALNVLSKYMATDLGRYGIRVNTCRPGFIHGAPLESYMQAQVTGDLSRDEIYAGIAKDIPLGVIPLEDDVARAVLMFVSDYTRAVTGAALDLNGGQWMAP